MYLELCTKDQYREFLGEFDATEDTIKTDTRYLMEWLEKQPHLPNIRDEEWLANFLLRGKNSLERTKKLLESYYTARALLPEIFVNRSVYSKDFLSAKNVSVFIPVTKLTPDGHRVMIFRVHEHGDKDFTPAINLIKAMQIIFDVCLRIDRVKGVTLVYDWENVTLSFASSLLTEIKKLITVQNKINPIRYDKIYLLHVSSYVQPVVNFSSFLIKKQFEKVIIWNKRPEDLVEVLPKECLPVEYGGTGKSLAALTSDFYEILKENNDWLVAQESVKADLTKLPLESKIKCNPMNDVDGSFRKLNID